MNLTRLHAHTHVRPRAPTRARARRVHSHAQAHARARAQERNNTHTPVRKLIHTRDLNAPRHAHEHVCTSTHTYAHPHASACTFTQPLTRSHLPQCGTFILGVAHTFRRTYVGTLAFPTSPPTCTPTCPHLQHGQWEARHAGDLNDTYVDKEAGQFLGGLQRGGKNIP